MGHKSGKYLVPIQVFEDRIRWNCAVLCLQNSGEYMCLDPDFESEICKYRVRACYSKVILIRFKSIIRRRLNNLKFVPALFSIIFRKSTYHWQRGSLKKLA